MQSVTLCVPHVQEGDSDEPRTEQNLYFTPATDQIQSHPEKLCVWLFLREPDGIKQFIGFSFHGLTF